MQDGIDTSGSHFTFEMIHHACISKVVFFCSFLVNWTWFLFEFASCMHLKSSFFFFFSSFLVNWTWFLFRFAVINAEMTGEF